MAELSNEGSGIVAASSVAENRPAASRSDTFTVAKVGTAARILVRASSSLSTRNLFDQHSPISNVSLAIGTYSSYSRATCLVRWLSGRKQRFAKAPYPKRVPRVRIPPSPPAYTRPPTQDVSPGPVHSRNGDENLFDRWGAKRMG